MIPSMRWSLALVALAGCGSSVTIADGGATVDAPVVDAPVVDAPVVDAPMVDAPCTIECPQPPMGCHYEGPFACRPGGCGTLVCPDAGAAVMCSGASPLRFPTFSRACGADADCFVARHQTDCCGNVRATSFHVSQRAAFDAAESMCRAQFPGCGCPARLPTDDADMTSTSGMFDARCTDGACRSYAR